MPTNTYNIDCEPSQSKDKDVQFSPFLQAFFNTAESVTPKKACRAAADTSQVPSTQATVPEDFLRFYKEPLQVEVGVGSLAIDKKKKYDQNRKYQQKRVDDVERSLIANPPEEPVTVTAWESLGT